MCYGRATEINTHVLLERLVTPIALIADYEHPFHTALQISSPCFFFCDDGKYAQGLKVFVFIIIIYTIHRGPRNGATKQQGSVAMRNAGTDSSTR